MKEYKIALMGARGVGKSAIIQQLVEGTFVYGVRYDRVDRYRKSFMYNNDECMLDLTDPLGVGEVVFAEYEDRFPPIKECHIKNNEGFVLVYSVMDHSTLEYIKTIRDKIVSIKGTEKVPIVVVENKNDADALWCNADTSMAYRLVTELPYCRFTDTSAMNHDEIQGIFYCCLKCIEEVRAEKKKIKIGKCNVL